MAPELVVPHDGPRRLRVRRSWVRAGFTALFGAAFGLGLWGFSIYRTSPEFEWGTSGWDLVYYSVQLFVLGAEATNQGGDLPWQLQTARFLAPVATGYAVFEAVRSLFADQFVLMRTRRMRGHAVVVGRTPRPTSSPRRSRAGAASSPAPRPVTPPRCATPGSRAPPSSTPARPRTTNPASTCSPWPWPTARTGSPTCPACA